MVLKKTKRVNTFYLVNQYGLRIRAFHVHDYNDILIPQYWGRKKRRAQSPPKKEVIMIRNY